MIEHFEIRASQHQARFLIFMYSLSGIAVIAYAEPGLLRLAILGLLVLLAALELGSLRRQDSIRLGLNPGTSLIELEREGVPQIYDKYKVYTTRWFAILQLQNEHNNRSLLLNSDRFDSDEDYQDFRFVIQKMERASNVA